MHVKKATHSQKIDTVFVLFIFSIFAISILIVLMLGASIYQNISDISEDGADERLALSYIWTKVKKSNDAGMIYVSDFYGENAIIIAQEIGDRKFHTVVYYDDGWLKELFAEEDLGLNRSAGSTIIRVPDITFEEAPFGMIKVTAGNKELFINPLSMR